MDTRYPAAWAAPASAIDVRDCAAIEFQVVTAPGVAYAPKRSLDGTTFVACNVRDKDGLLVSSITAAGIYTAEGGGYFQLATGSGSTITLRGAAAAAPVAAAGTVTTRVTGAFDVNPGITAGWFLDETGTKRPLAVLGYLNGSGGLCVAASGDSSTGQAYVTPRPLASGGLLLKRLVGAANGVIKGSAGQLYSGTFTNTNAAIRYLQVYNKATAGTLSTDTPVLTVPLPPNVSVVVDFAGIGAEFTTGISWQFTTDDVAIPTTAGATTDLHGFATYK